jgi:hypothetical protein
MSLTQINNQENIITGFHALSNSIRIQVLDLLGTGTIYSKRLRI